MSSTTSQPTAIWPSVILDDLIDFGEIRDVPVRDDDGLHAVFIRRHGFFAQTADG